MVSKCSSKSKRLVFTLKEDSDGDAKSSSSDGSEIEMDFEDVEVPVYEENEKTGKKVKSKKLSYMMSHVDDRVGAKINLKDQYYDAQAVQSYTDKGKRLMKYVKKDEP